MCAESYTVFVVMGVSGSGKTTVGRALADALQCRFVDGDAFHSAENVAKMRAGIPLTDIDRTPWLAALADLVERHLADRAPLVLACSALKQAYRDLLRVDTDRVRFVYLAGTYDLIRQRLAAREGHYMQADLLQSQFDALEPPTASEALRVSATDSVAEIVAQICVDAA